MKIISYFLQSVIIYSFFFIGRILGLNLSRKIFSNLFLIIGPAFKSKKIIKKNLNILAEKTPDLNNKNVIQNMWKNYGMTFIEYMFLGSFKKKNSHITIKNDDYLSKIISKKEPVIFISGHFANFELMSMEITKKIFP